MLIGKLALNLKNTEDLLSNIESEIYKITTNLSKEIISFINILQNENI